MNTVSDHSAPDQPLNQPLDHSDIFSLQFDRDLLKDRVILVTGAGDGIGRVAATTYAKHGARVVLAGRTVPKLENTYDDILAAQAPGPSIYPIDFAGAEETDYDNMAVSIEENLGRLDGVLFNASVLGSRRPLSGYYTSDWDACMNVNVRSQFLMTKALLPLMERGPDSKIIYTSSSVGRKGRAHWGAYAVSKFATEGLMQTLADEMDGISNLCTNCINPGATRTKMRSTAYPAEDPATVKSPEEIMPLYLYLMSSLSAGVSGYSLDAQPK